MRKLRWMIAALAAMAVLVAGCGDDGGSEDAGDQPTEAGATMGSDVEGGGEGDDGDDDAGGGGAGDGGDLSALLSENCRFLMTGAYLNPFAALGGGAGADFDELTSYFDEVARNAPSEIAPDMAVIAGALAQFADVLRDVDLSNPQSFADPQLQAALEDLEDTFGDEYEAAGERVGQWLEDNCSG